MSQTSLQHHKGDSSLPLYEDSQLELETLETLVFSDERPREIQTLFQHTDERLHFFNALTAQMDLETTSQDNLVFKLSALTKHLQQYRDFLTKNNQNGSSSFSYVQFLTNMTLLKGLLSSYQAQEFHLFEFSKQHGSTPSNAQRLAQGTTQLSLADRVGVISQLIETIEAQFVATRPHTQSTASHSSESTSPIFDTPMTFVQSILHPTSITSTDKEKKDILFNIIQPLPENEDAIDMITEQLLPYISQLKLDYSNRFENFRIAHRILVLARVSFPNLAEIVASHLSLSAQILSGSEKQWQHLKPYAVNSFGDLPVHSLLTTEQLETLGNLYPAVWRFPQFCMSKVDSVFPKQFVFLKDGRNVYSMRCDDGKPIKLTQPLVLMSEKEFEKEKNNIPSFVLTAINYYQQAIDIWKQAKNCHRSHNSMYVSSLAVLLDYTARHNVYRFDLFEHWLTKDIITSFHANPTQRVYTKWAKGDFCTPQAFSSALFPTVSFDDLIYKYLSVLFIQPKTKSPNQFAKYLDSSFTNELYYGVRLFNSGCVVECSIKNIDTHAIAGSNIESCGNKDASFCYSVTNQLDQTTNAVITNANNATLAAQQQTQQYINQQELKEIVGLTYTNSLYPSHNSMNPPGFKDGTDPKKKKGDDDSPNLKELSDVILKEAKDKKLSLPQFLRDTTVLDFVTNDTIFYKLDPDQGTQRGNLFKDKDGSTVKTDIEKKQLLQPIDGSYSIDSMNNILSLSMVMQNVKSLTINIFSVDPVAFYEYLLSQIKVLGLAHALTGNNQDLNLETVFRTDLSELDLSSLNLEGFIPHSSTSIALGRYVSEIASLSPWNKYLFKLALADLPTNGVFIIEFVSGEIIKRACIRRGGHIVFQTNHSDGALGFTVLDQLGTPVQNPVVYVGTEKFTTKTTQASRPNHPDPNQIVVPFDNQPHQYAIVTSDDPSSPASLIAIDQTNPNNKFIALTNESTDNNDLYDLGCSFFVSTEALVSNSDQPNHKVSIHVDDRDMSNHLHSQNQLDSLGAATIIFRPVIHFNGSAISPDNFNIIKSTLSLTVTCHDGTNHFDTLENFDLFSSITDSQTITLFEATHRFNIPPSAAQLIASLDIVLSPKDQPQREIPLMTTHTQPIGSISKSSSSGLIILRKEQHNFVIYTVDIAGNPVPYVPLDVTAHCFYYGNPLSHQYCTGPKGRVVVGACVGVARLAITLGKKMSTLSSSNILENLSLFDERSQVTYFLTKDHLITWDSEYSVFVGDTDDDLAIPFPSDVVFNPLLRFFYSQQDELSGFSHHTVQSLFAKMGSSGTKNLSVIFDHMLSNSRLQLLELSSGAPKALCNQLLSYNPGTNTIYIKKSNLNECAQYRLSFLDETTIHSTIISTYPSVPVNSTQVDPKLRYGTLFTEAQINDILINIYKQQYLITLCGVLKTNHLRPNRIAISQIKTENKTVSITITNPTSSSYVYVFASNAVQSIQQFINTFGTDCINNNNSQKIQFATNSANIITTLFPPTKSKARYLPAQAFSNASSITTRNGTMSAFYQQASSAQFINFGVCSQERVYSMEKNRIVMRSLVSGQPEMGNLLPQPSLCLAPKHLGDSSASVESTNFAFIPAPPQTDQETISYNRPSSVGLSLKKKNSVQIDNSVVEHDLHYIPPHLFANRARMILSVPLKEQSSSTLDFTLANLENYSNLTVLVIDRSTGGVAHQDLVVYDLPTPSDFLTANQFTSSLDLTRQYHEQIRVDIIPSNTSVVIGQPELLQYNLFTSTQDLISLFSYIADNKPSSNPAFADSLVQSTLSQFGFLAHWPKFDEKAKLQVIASNVCHELNLFLFFNDRAFFEEHVRERLSHRFQPTVVDLWLIAQPIITRFIAHDEQKTWLINQRQVAIQKLKILSTDCIKFNELERILIMNISDRRALRRFALYTTKKLCHPLSFLPTLSNQSNFDTINEDYTQVINTLLQRQFLRVDTKGLQTSTLAVNSTITGGSTSPIDPVTTPVPVQNSAIAVLDLPNIEDLSDSEFELEEFPLPTQHLDGPVLPSTPKHLSSSPTAIATKLLSTPVVPTTITAAYPAMLGTPVPPTPSLMTGTSVPSQRPAPPNKKTSDVILPYLKTHIPSSFALNQFAETTWACNQSSFTWNNFWADFAIFLSNSPYFDTAHLENDYTNLNMNTYQPIINGNAVPSTFFVSQHILDVSMSSSPSQHLLALAITQLSPISEPSTLLGPATTTPQSTSFSATVLTASEVVTNKLAQLYPSQPRDYQQHGQSAFYQTVTTQLTPILVIHKQLQPFEGPTDSLTPTSPQSTTQTQPSPLQYNKQHTPMSVSSYYIDVATSNHFKSPIYITNTNAMAANRTYVCRVIVTNQSSKRTKVNAFVQLPNGATPMRYDPGDQIIGLHDSTYQHTDIPFLSGKKSISLDLDPYNSHSISYSFVLSPISPQKANFIHYGALVTNSPSLNKNALFYNNDHVQLLATAPNITLRVVSPSLQQPNRENRSTANRRRSIMAIKDDFQSRTAHLYDPFNPMSAIFAEAREITTHGADDEVCDLLYDLFVYGGYEDILKDKETKEKNDDTRVEDELDEDNITKLLISAFDHSTDSHVMSDADMELILPLIFWRFHNEPHQFSESQLQHIHLIIEKQGYAADTPHAFFISRLRLYCSIIHMLKSYLTTHVSASIDRASDHISQLLSYSLYFLRFMVENQIPFSSTPTLKPIVTQKESDLLAFASGLLFSRHFKLQYGAHTFVHAYSHIEFAPLISSRIHAVGTIIGHNSMTTGSQYLEPTPTNASLLKTYKVLLQSVLISTTHTLSSCGWQVLLPLLYYSFLFNHRSRSIKIVIALLSKALPPQNILSTTEPPEDTQALICELGCHPQLGFMLAHLDISCGGKLRNHLPNRLLFVLERLFNLAPRSLRTKIEPRESSSTTTGRSSGPDASSPPASPSLTRLPSSLTTLLNNTTRSNSFNLSHSMLNSKILQNVLEGDYTISSALALKYRESSSYSHLFESINSYLDAGGVTGPFISPLESDSGVVPSASTPELLAQSPSPIPSLVADVRHQTDKTEIVITYTNIIDSNLTLKIHYTDTELLLSHHPFANQGNSVPTSIILKPHLTLTLDIPKNNNTMSESPFLHTHSGTVTCNLNTNLAVNSQVTISAHHSNLSIVCPLFYTAFNVFISNRHTKIINAIPSAVIPQYIIQLVDKHSNSPVSGAYIKSFVQTDQGSQFLCDGYTSLNGKASFNPYIYNGFVDAKIRSYAIVISHISLGTTVVYLSVHQ